MVSTAMWCLRPFTFFAASKPRSPLFRRLHGLAVHDGGAGGGLSARFDPASFSQGVVDTLQRSSWLVGVPVDGAPRRKVMWHHPAGTPRVSLVEQRVDDLAQAMPALPICMW
jgi:hypothetical protein